MIYSLDEFNHLVRDRLAGISVSNRGNTLTLDNRHISYGVPEAEVVESRVFPAISFHMINDLAHERNRLQGGEFRTLVPAGTDPADLPWAGNWNGTIPTAPFYVYWPYPEPTRMTYQFDLYAHSQQSLIELYTNFLKRFPRRRGHLVDSDGHDIQLMSFLFLDFTRDIDMLGETKERVFRRTLTYTFDVWLQLADSPDRLVKPVEGIQIEYFSNRTPDPEAVAPDFIDELP